LQSAERERRRVQFNYTDKNNARTQRRVDPYGFIVSNGRIYLVGYDHTRTDMRVFAVDNVSELAVTPQTFEKPADFNLEAYGANSVSGVVQGDAVTDVTVRFSPLIAKAAAAASPIARDRRVVPLAEGGVDITYRVADPLEIVRWSLGWGAEAEVLSPEEARRAAADIARQLAARYG
jgi:proteasome accessory factor B